METHLILGISTFFLLFIIVLHGALILAVRPKFLFEMGTDWTALHPAILSAIFFLLFMICFCMGSYSYGLRTFNGLLYF